MYERLTKLDPKEVAELWDKNRPHFTKRGVTTSKLIDRHSRTSAQGEVLRLAGLSNQDLQVLRQDEADQYVAWVLGLPTYQSVLLRVVDSSGFHQSPEYLEFNPNFCHQIEAINNPHSLLANDANLILTFARIMDGLRASQWQQVKKQREELKKEDYNNYTRGLYRVEGNIFDMPRGVAEIYLLQTRVAYETAIQLQVKTGVEPRQSFWQRWNPPGDKVAKAAELVVMEIEHRAILADSAGESLFLSMFPDTQGKSLTLEKLTALTTASNILFPQGPG